MAKNIPGRNRRGPGGFDPDEESVGPDVEAFFGSDSGSSGDGSSGGGGSGESSGSGGSGSSGGGGGGGSGSASFGSESGGGSSSGSPSASGGSASSSTQPSSSASSSTSSSSPGSSGSSSSAGTLKRVTFTGGWIIYKDVPSGTAPDPYDAPQWQAKPERKYPYLYRQAAKLKVSATWGVPAGINPKKALSVKGSGTDGINIDKVAATYNADKHEISISNIAANTAFAANKTKYYNPFTITWSMSDDNGATWHDAGASDNVIYVCLRGPQAGAPTPYRTVVHLACSNDGATNADQAVANTWSLFTAGGSGPANVNGWDETAQSWTRLLYYYQANTNFSQNPTIAPGLLKVGTGQCGSWKHLLHDAWMINGASSSYITAIPNGTLLRKTITMFLVKDWTYNVSHTGKPGLWELYLTPIEEMVPPPAGGFGDLTNNNTIPGQNTSPPSEKVFANHQFLKYKTTFYDPSYGVTYASAADFQSKAIAGFGIPDTTKPANTAYYVAKTPRTLQIKFTNQ